MRDFQLSGSPVVASPHTLNNVIQLWTDCMLLQGTLTNFAELTVHNKLLLEVSFDSQLVDQRTASLRLCTYVFF